MVVVLGSYFLRAAFRAVFFLAVFPFNEAVLRPVAALLFVLPLAFAALAAGFFFLAVAFLAAGFLVAFLTAGFDTGAGGIISSSSSVTGSSIVGSGVGSGVSNGISIGSVSDSEGVSYSSSAGGMYSMLSISSSKVLECCAEADGI
jgi:hypothetical protein